MLIETLKLLFNRELNKLKPEIASYKEESRIWSTDKQITNSAENLCLHLIGNLNTYIGAEFGNTKYVRDRPLEFSQKDVPRRKLIKKIEDTIIVVNNALDNVTEADLRNNYPMLVLDKETSAEYFLIHLLAHLTYHLGQVNYQRRLLDV